MVISVSNTQSEGCVNGNPGGVSRVILGGTFDPVHSGHLVSAQELAQRMGYSSITLMPCGQAYHKQGSTAAKHRLNMLNIAIQDIDALCVDGREVLREGATYTVDTLTELRYELGPNAHIVWVMGTDAALLLDKWYQWQQIFTLANVIVISRAGEPELTLPHWPATQVDNVETFKQHASGCYFQIGLTPINLSSSEVRQAINNHQSVDNHVPHAVIEYIEQHGLYRGLN
jgi:nicotinate-nucleotide adenylyltransferase